MKPITKQSITKMMEEELANMQPQAITKNKIKKMMAEELAKLKEGLHDEGLREMISDFLSSEISTWHGEAKGELQKHVEANGFDLSREVLQALSVGGVEEELTNMKESPDRLIMQYQNDAKGAAMGLLTAGKDMAGAGSTTSASDYASYVIKQANIIVDAMVALEKHNNSGQEGLSEARKRPLKRHRDAFDKNTRMVSDLQKTISSYLKESGAKLNKNHTAVIEKISTRLMHIANSPMINLSEGDSNSRMISSLEKIGEEIKGIAHMSADPAVLDRLEFVEEMIQQLWQDMMGVQ